MRELIWSKGFIRAFKRFQKRHPELIDKIEIALTQLLNDPYHSSLHTHKLKGEFTGSWSCSITHEHRLIFQFVAREGKEAEDLYLMTIGTHDEVY